MRHLGLGGGGRGLGGLGRGGGGRGLGGRGSGGGGLGLGGRGSGGGEDCSPACNSGHVEQFARDGYGGCSQTE